MPFHNKLDKIKKISKDNDVFQQLTLGEVVDTNDPQQMGRVRIACPYFGDGEDTTIEDIPWATPITPLAGVTETASRGRGEDKTVGAVAYGMFNVPKVGSTVIVACIEGDPIFRVYLGGLHDQFLTHTLPHGRYTYQSTAASANAPSGDEPSGPLSSSEDPILPLYDSQTESFTKSSSTTGQQVPPSRKSFEYRSRGSDKSVAGLENAIVNSNDVIYSGLPDDREEKFTEADGNNIENTQGYNTSRVEEGLVSSLTGLLYDPQVYSWTTPGFHSISMSDNSDNCRIRFRSTHGSQIILDDTNERIYVSTANGKTWIELDEAGNIDIYGERNISIHAEKDVNITAGDTFRVKAKNGIHMISEGEMRLHTKNGKMHIKSGDTTEIHSINDMSITVSNLILNALNNVDIKAIGGVLDLEAGADINILAGTTLQLQSGTGTNILSGGKILNTGSEIHFNGPGAAPAFPAEDTVPSNTFEAWWTNRVPEHEPWGRIMTKPTVTDLNLNNTHAGSSEYAYTDINVGRIERGSNLARNPKWHR